MYHQFIIVRMTNDTFWTKFKIWYGYKLVGVCADILQSFSPLYASMDR